jgi:hypothetical protein
MNFINWYVNWPHLRRIVARCILAATPAPLRVGTLIGKSSRFSAGSWEEAGRSCTGEQPVLDVEYNKAGSSDWCATWPRCIVANSCRREIDKISSRYFLTNVKGVNTNDWYGNILLRLECEGARFWQISAYKTESKVTLFFVSEVTRCGLANSSQPAGNFISNLCKISTSTSIKRKPSMARMLQVIQ